MVEKKLKSVVFKLIIQLSTLEAWCEMAPIKISLSFTNQKSGLNQNTGLGNH